ncbi:MAG: urea amidolyase associated protein UAAP1 [Solibacillus sp.]
MTFSITIPVGGKWSKKIAKGKLLTFKVTAANPNVALLFYSAADTIERYSMPDTLKAQYTAFLKQGNILMSDNGKAMISIVEDTVGWHDAISGYTTRALTDQKYGVTTYETQRNDWYRSGQENLLTELFRNGLSGRDLGPVVNLFSKVIADDEGQLSFVENNATVGDTVTLRTEMDVLLILSNTPNPYNPQTQYPSSPIELVIEDAPEMDVVNDLCVNYRGENKRAFENTWQDELLMKGAGSYVGS